MDYQYDIFRHVKNFPLLGYITILQRPYLVIRVYNGNRLFIFTDIEDIDDYLCHHCLAALWCNYVWSDYNKYEKPALISYESE